MSMNSLCCCSRVDDVYVKPRFGKIKYPPPPPPRMIKWPPSSAKFEIAPRALIRGFTGFSFLPAASKEKQATEKQVS